MRREREEGAGDPRRRRQRPGALEPGGKSAAAANPAEEELAAGAALARRVPGQPRSGPQTTAASSYLPGCSDQGEESGPQEKNAGGAWAGTRKLRVALRPPGRRSP